MKKRKGTSPILWVVLLVVISGIAISNMTKSGMFTQKEQTNNHSHDAEQGAPEGPTMEQRQAELKNKMAQDKPNGKQPTAGHDVNMVQEEVAERQGKDKYKPVPNDTMTSSMWYDEKSNDSK